MKLVFALVPMLALLATPFAAPAMADEIDFSQIKCSDFVAGSKDDAVLMLTWLEGYFAKKNEAPVLHGAKAAQDGKNIHEYCLAHSDVDVFNAAKAVGFGK